MHTLFGFTFTTTAACFGIMGMLLLALVINFLQMRETNLLKSITVMFASIALACVAFDTLDREHRAWLKSRQQLADNISTHKGLTPATH